MSIPQERKHHLAIIGLGATGCALLPMAATFPFHRITLIDGDTVEEGNLPRQPLYGKADAGRFKTEVAMERTAHLHQHGRVITEQQFVDKANIVALLDGATIVADCTDDIHARALIDRTCGELWIPLVAGSVHGTQLQVMTLHEQRQPLSLRSYFPGRAGRDQDDCDMSNVPITVPALTAVLMAHRIMALLSGDHGPAMMDLVDVERASWIRIAPPLPPDDDRLIA